MPTTKTDKQTEVHESFIDENGIPQQRNGSGTVVDMEVLPLWQAYKQNPQDDQLRNQLLENYLPVVKVHAERLWHRLPDGVELDDLFSAGCFGMLNAIGSFDLSRGIKFEAYCVTRVRGAMLDELRHMDWVPRMVRSQATKLYNATNELEAKLGRHPTEEELSEHMGIAMPELEKIMATSSSINLISLDKRKWKNSEGNKSMTEMDIVADKRFASPSTRMSKNDIVRLVTKGLSRAERLIMILYYFEEMTMKEIGVTLDLSESRVSQMHSSIVNRLRSQLDTRKGEFNL